ncbi:hypothetical protein CWO07_17675 [Vibrio splendidus]|uniref:Uncharacterized protein n=1 Tax=Vibrio splendidus TaxID=29497 RepID=A0A2T5ESF2_VIBSP|nr:hypothetical protein BCU63_03465 [Vibrio splendidus]PMJ72607.1 hypothetical protein BCU23_16350 [Vibrio splendidus]PTP29344.1 hypothetical protein CWO07_17675 [Vibrio splendidus]
MRRDQEQIRVTGKRDAKRLRAEVKNEDKNMIVVLLAPPLYHDCYLAKNINIRGGWEGLVRHR